MRISFQVFCISDFAHFSLGIKVLTLLPKISTYSKFYIVFVYISSRMKARLSLVITKWLRKYFAVSITLAQNLTGRPLSISSESFIIARVVQHYFVILFFLSM